NELDPYLVVREPSVHIVHGQPPFWPPPNQHIITSTVDGGAGSAQFDFLTVVEWTGVGDTGRTGKVLWRCTGDVSTGKFFSSLLSSYRDCLLLVRFWGEADMTRPPLAYLPVADDP